MRQAAKLAVAVGAIGVAGAVAIAQQSTNPSTGEHRRAAVARQTAVTPPVNTTDPKDPAQWLKLSESDPHIAIVSFPGGTLEQYFRGVEAVMLAPHGVSIVLPDSAARIKLPPLNLRAARRMSALNAPGMIMPGITLTALPNPDPQSDQTLQYLVGIPPDFLGQFGMYVEPRLDLDFPGGTVGQYVDAVRAAQPAANIVVSPDAAEFPMPPVQLKGVSVEAAMGAIKQEVGDSQSGKSWVGAEPIPTRGSAEQVFRVMAGSQPGQSNQTVVISLAETLRANGPRALKIEDILSAIEAATNMTSPPPKIRFHAETSLLLFHGTADQVSTLERTVDALRRTAGTPE